MAKAFLRQLGETHEPLAPIACKMAIVAVAVNNGDTTLLYDTVLADGTVEVNGGKILPGQHAVIQPDGELHVLADAKGRDTFAKGYNSDRNLPFDTANSLATQRGLTLTTPEQIVVALQALQQKNPGSELLTHLGWFEAKGRSQFWRVKVEIDMGWGVQTSYLPHGIAYSLVYDEAFLVGLSEIA
ncbi:MAG: hypothetical protein B7X02_01135, partial [Rhodospirillales bacterium 12-54-5]